MKIMCIIQFDSIMTLISLNVVTTYSFMGLIRLEMFARLASIFLFNFYVMILKILENKKCAF